MKKILIGAATASILALSACSGDGRFLPTVTGSTYDLLVVGADSVWNRPSGRIVDSLFSSPMPALPEEEPFFKVIHLKTAEFDATVKTARNIVFYEVDPSRYTKGSLNYINNYFAKPQAVAKITAPNEQVLAAFVKEKGDELRRYFINAEEGRALNYFSSYQNLNFSRVIQKKFGVDILVPADLNKMRDTTGFVWMSNGNLNVNQNMVVFTSPYRSVEDFSPEHLVAVQDSFTKLYIPGPSEGSYMKRLPIIPLTSEVLYSKNSDYCVEVRGRWHCPIDVMGGPFVSRNYLSADHRNIVTAMVFLYAPGQEKRNRLRMLEAAAGSLKVKVAAPDSTAAK
ncbi:MAG: DUF4837 family protein [Paludibacteraceae bacterium]|nr:DUF4837 family protein [Paludibacteraceae bacterium]